MKVYLVKLKLNFNSCVCVFQTAAEVITLEEVKKAKDLEIEKYKKYLNKAKKIIENIGDKSQASEDGLEVGRTLV